MPRALTREFLMEGTLPAILARAWPSLRILTEQERAASLHNLLASRPPGTDGVWVFAYGSLIWNPTVHFLESRPAIVQGWHRAFCLSVVVGRGTPENPGLMLGLQPGGSCAGVAFRIGEDVMEHELTLLWRREMVAGGYIPLWVPLEQAAEYPLPRASPSPSIPPVQPMRPTCQRPKSCAAWQRPAAAWAAPPNICSARATGCAHSASPIRWWSG